MFNRRKGSFAEIDFSVPGMMCEGCADTIRAALSAIEGVERVKPNAWRKRVRVHYDAIRVDPSALKAALTGIGYEASEA